MGNAHLGFGKDRADRNARRTKCLEMTVGNSAAHFFYLNVNPRSQGSGSQKILNKEKYYCVIGVTCV